MRRVLLFLLLWHWKLLSCPHLNAQSTLVYKQFQPHGGSSYPYDAFGERVWESFYIEPVNLMINGTTQFAFYQDYNTLAMSFPITNRVVGLVTNDLKGFGLISTPIALQAGANIGPLGAGGVGWINGNIDPLLSYDESSPVIGESCQMIGFFPGIRARYIGFQFQENSRSFYGWVQLGVPEYCVTHAWLYDYAYETIPDKPILAGAVPQVAMSQPTLVAPDLIRLSWHSQAGIRYQIQYKESLPEEFPVWGNFGSVITAVTDLTTQDALVKGTSRFYRVVQVQ